MKRISAKVGSYEKDGVTKGIYIKIGVILSNDKGEFVLLDPSVNLAGVLIQQRLASGKSSDKVICSIFVDEKRAQGPDRPIEDDEVPF